jgi:hypothetical protein
MIKIKKRNKEEFDPGSERTLVVGFTPPSGTFGNSARIQEQNDECDRFVKVYL